MLGAAGIWLFRIPRMIAWIWSESLPHKDSNCGLASLNCCWEPIGRCFDACAGSKSDRKKAAEKWQSGDSLLQQTAWLVSSCFDTLTFKIFKSDLTTHFFPAKEKAQKYIQSQSKVSKLTGECRPCTFIGVLAGGIAGFVVCYCTLSFGSIYNDPSKSSFIMDPLMVAFVAFFLCCHIAYDFCALLDHMADSLLYCFAYNKKFNKKTVDRFVPEEIQDLIGGEEIEKLTKPQHSWTGKAQPDMFVSTWWNLIQVPRQSWEHQYHSVGRAKLRMLARQSPRDVADEMVEMHIETAMPLQCHIFEVIRNVYSHVLLSRRCDTFSLKIVEGELTERLSKDWTPSFKAVCSYGTCTVLYVNLMSMKQSHLHALPSLPLDGQFEGR
eukprot:s2424_g1.t1